MAEEEVEVSEVSEVDTILQKHRGELTTYSEFDRKPVTETGEVFGNLDNPRLTNFNTIMDKEGRRNLTILDELTYLGLWETPLSQTHKEMSVSLQGKGREQKTDIAKGLINARSSSGGGIANLFARQPEVKGGKDE